MVLQTRHGLLRLRLLWLCLLPFSLTIRPNYLLLSILEARTEKSQNMKLKLKLNPSSSVQSVDARMKAATGNHPVDGLAMMVVVVVMWIKKIRKWFSFHWFWFIGTTSMDTINYRDSLASGGWEMVWPEEGRRGGRALIESHGLHAHSWFNSLLMALHG